MHLDVEFYELTEPRLRDFAEAVMSGQDPELLLFPQDLTPRERQEWDWYIEEIAPIHHNIVEWLVVVEALEQLGQWTGESIDRSRAIRVEADRMAAVITAEWEPPDTSGLFYDALLGTGLVPEPAPAALEGDSASVFFEFRWRRSTVGR